MITAIVITLAVSTGVFAALAYVFSEEAKIERAEADSWRRLYMIAEDRKFYWMRQAEDLGYAGAPTDDDPTLVD